MIPLEFGKTINKHVFSVDFHLFLLMFHLKTPVISRGMMNLVITCLCFIMIGYQATRLSHFWRTVTSKLYWFQGKFLGCSLPSTSTLFVVTTCYNQSYKVTTKSYALKGLVCPPQKKKIGNLRDWVGLRCCEFHGPGTKRGNRSHWMLQFFTSELQEPSRAAVESTPFFSQVGDP